MVHQVTLERGDLILAFTDGIPDTLNEDGTSFGNQRLREIYQTSESDPGKILENITQELHQFIGSAEQFDDITVMAIKREPDNPDE
jgi:sigma-B regulation protein RsbU (phosphoserine phosphatase)